MDKKNILIVEDEMIHGIFLKASIQNSGFSVLDIVSRGEDAVKSAIENKPGLIITDILLKDEMTGVDVIEEVHKHNMIPVIYITALSENRLLERAEMTKPVAIIYKPYEIHSLLSILASLFN
ncbi:MAG TPA: response regulator [Spirochaetota bacterium]|nr:response regulator [Spirochaetota bacterium]